ncbi:hypothetical protein WDU94_002229 [Cyamophila willieti]
MNRTRRLMTQVRTILKNKAQDEMIELKITGEGSVTFKMIAMGSVTLELTLSMTSALLRQLFDEMWILEFILSRIFSKTRRVIRNSSFDILCTR